MCVCVKRLKVNMEESRHREELIQKSHSEEDKEEGEDEDECFCLVALWAG